MKCILGFYEARPIRGPYMCMSSYNSRPKLVVCACWAAAIWHMVGEQVECMYALAATVSGYHHR